MADTIAPAAIATTSQATAHLFIPFVKQRSRFHRNMQCTGRIGYTGFGRVSRDEPLLESASQACSDESEEDGMSGSFYTEDEEDSREDKMLCMVDLVLSAGPKRKKNRATPPQPTPLKEAKGKTKAIKKKPRKTMKKATPKQESKSQPAGPPAGDATDLTATVTAEVGRIRDEMRELYDTITQSNLKVNTMLQQLDRAREFAQAARDEAKLAKEHAEEVERSAR